MKKFLLFPLLVFMTAVIVPACSDDEEEIFPPAASDSIGGDTIINGGDTIGGGNSNTEVLKARKYNGRMVVNDTYVQDSVFCEITRNSDKITLNLFNIKFAANMPMSINLTVPEILCGNGDGGEEIFQGDSIVPMMGTIPAQAFMFENIEGSIVKNRINFTATISGRGTFNFRGEEVKE
jgi:hypothetical protein